MSEGRRWWTRGWVFTAETPGASYDGLSPCAAVGVVGALAVQLSVCMAWGGWEGT